MLKGARGFTTIELVVVAVLVAMILAIGVGNMRGALAREEIDGWVRAIAHDVTAGQQAAMARRMPVTAAFQNQTYTIAVSGGGTLRNDTLPAHITFGPTFQSVTFDRRGTPSTVFNLTVTSTTAGRSYTIQVAAGTGRVTFSEP